MTSPGSSALVRHWKSLYASASVLVDSLIVYGSVAIGYLINFSRFSFEGLLQHQWKLVIYSVALYTSLNAIFGVYRQAYTTPLRFQVSAAVRSYVMGTLVIFATLFLFKNTYYANGVLLTYVVVLPAMFLLGRLILDKVRAWFQRRRIGLAPTVIVLVDSGAAGQLHSLDSYPSIGYNVLSVADISVLDETGAQEEVARNLARHNPTHIIFGCLTLVSPAVSALSTKLISSGFNIRLISPEVHDALTRMRLYDFAGISLSPLQDPQGWWRLAAKRVFDVLASLLVVLVTAPFLIVIAVAILLESTGGAFFRQIRSLAPGSKPVRVFKFRSMRAEPEEPKGTSPPKAEIARTALFKSPEDPRITRVGRFIRKYSLDELPQLLNVIAGEMSLVGPRPLPAVDFLKQPSDEMMKHIYELRACSRPGLTGLWQISGRSGLSFQQMVILDLYYAEHQSFLFDLEILFETIPAVISGRGAY